MKEVIMLPCILAKILMQNDIIYSIDRKINYGQ